MDVYQIIIKLLDDNGIKFKEYVHEAVLSSEEAARVRGTEMKQGAKALVMWADKKPVMLVLSAVDTVDTKAFKKAYGVRDLRMASTKEVEELTGTKVGAVPPFGNILGMSVYVDEELGKNKEIVFNAGLRTRSLRIRYDDWIKLVKPVTGRFGKKK